MTDPFTAAMRDPWRLVCESCGSASLQFVASPTPGTRGHPADDPAKTVRCEGCGRRATGAYDKKRGVFVERG